MDPESQPQKTQKEPVTPSNSMFVDSNSLDQNLESRVKSYESSGLLYLSQWRILRAP